MTEPVFELAQEISNRDAQPAAQMRTAVVTETEDIFSCRVKTSISGDAWISRLQDCTVGVGDRVSVLQQGPVMLVIGRLAPGAEAAVPIGTVLTYAGASAPYGWFMCNGGAISRSLYFTLFGIVGTTYGVGDGSTTFNLPDLRNRVPVGQGSTYSLGQTGGAATVTLNQSQMPSHSHATWASGTFLDNASVAGGGSADILLLVDGSTGDTGGGGSHENMPPFQALSYIIRAR